MTEPESPDPTRPGAGQSSLSDIADAQDEDWYRRLDERRRAHPDPEPDPEPGRRKKARLQREEQEMHAEVLARRTIQLMAGKYQPLRFCRECQEPFEVRLGFVTVVRTWRTGVYLCLPCAWVTGLGWGGRLKVKTRPRLDPNRQKLAVIRWEPKREEW